MIKNEDIRLKRVSDFLTVLKLYEKEIFGDTYYDLNYRKNATLEKPIKLTKDDDVRRCMHKFSLISNSIDLFDYPSKSFAAVTSMVAISLLIFMPGKVERLQDFSCTKRRKN